MKCTSIFLWLCFALLIACSPKTIPNNSPQAEAVAEEPAKVVDVDPLAEAIPVDPRVRMGELDNGMKYYVQYNEKPADRAELRLVVNAGSILEDEDQLGLAHFVEHMCFNGTKHFEKSELVDYLESVGTRFGPDLNAYTSFDETVYMLQVRTDDAAMFDKGMLILQDWASAVTFDHEEIDKERGVVVSEWRSRLSPDQRMQKVYYPVMYKHSRYAERLPIGKPEIIEHASYETVKRFYKDWYRPDLMAVVVVGNVDVDAVESKIKSHFGEIEAQANPRKRALYSVPRHDETLVSIVSDSEAPFTTVRVMYKHRETPNKTMGDYRHRLVRNLYNRMLNARLREISKQPDPPFLFAYSGYGGNVGDLETYTSFANVPEGKVLDGMEAILTENERVLQHGFVETELERQKQELMETIERGYKEMDKTESGRLASRYVYHYLQDNPIPSPAQTLDLHRLFLPTIRLDEVNALAQKWIVDHDRVVVITGPARDDSPLPSEAETRSVLDVVAHKDVDAYEDSVIDQPLMSEVLSPTAISSKEVLDNVGVTKVRLENGVEVYFKPTDFKNDEIMMSATSEGGTSLYPDEDYQSASNASRIISESGIGDFDALQLEKLLTGKTVRVSPFIGAYGEGMSGSASPDDVETMFQLIYLYFTAVRKDEEAFQSYVFKQKNLYKNLMANPQFFFFDYSSKIKYGEHPRTGFPSAEDYDAISLDRAVDIFKERFGDASDFVFFFVGNFEVDEMLPLIQRYLGNLPAVDRGDVWKDIGIRVQDGVISERVNRGKAPKTQVELYFHGDFEWSPDNHYRFQSMLDVLRIKMRESMREDKGGVYGVGVRGGTSKVPRESYSITISFNSDPPKTDELIKTAMQDIQNARENGASDTDLDKVRETQRQQRVKGLKENRFWMRQLERGHRYDLDADHMLLESLEQQIQSLTAEDIKRAASRYFDMSRFIQIVMEPEVEEEPSQ